MMFGPRFIGGICNCDYPVCDALTIRLDWGLNMLKGHYVAIPDYECLQWLRHLCPEMPVWGFENERDSGQGQYRPDALFWLRSLRDGVSTGSYLPERPDSDTRIEGGMVMVDKSALKIPRPNPVDPGRLPAKFPKIEIDHTKCTVPFWCKKCLQMPAGCLPGLL